MVELEYAKALFELSEEKGITKEVKDEFRATYKTATADSDFMSVMTSPFILKEEKKKLIKNIYGNFSSLLIDFLYVLVDNDRFGKVKEIYIEYKHLIRSSSNILKVEVKSTKELTQEQINIIEKALKHKYTDQTLEIRNIIDKELLGGFQITVDDEVVDLSLKASLKRLKESI